MPVPKSPKSPITKLAEALSSMPALAGFAPVLAGKNKLAATRSPPSIVIFPVTGGYQVGTDNVESMVDVDLKIEARLWGLDLDQADELRQRFMQALREQATGREADAAKDDDAGFFFQWLEEHWDVSPDTSAQGQELAVIFVIRMSAAPTLSFGIGEVDATSINPAS